MIDDKLKEIWLEIDEKLSDEDLADISLRVKQAYAEYIPVIIEHREKLMTGQEWEEKALKEGWRRPG